MEIITKENFINLIADDGMTITSWVDGVDDIIDFNCGKLIYTPLNADISKYFEITDEVANELYKRQEEEIRKREEENI